MCPFARNLRGKRLASPASLRARTRHIPAPRGCPALSRCPPQPAPLFPPVPDVLKQQGHFHDLNTLAYSADGSMIATGGDDGKVCSGKGEEGGVPSHPHPHPAARHPSTCLRFPCVVNTDLAVCGLPLLAGAADGR